MQARFNRIQHQVLARRLIHICQTSTVEDYVRRFSDLVDRLSVHETNPDPIHYTTKFLDGLKPAVRVLVALQQPQNLDTAYTLALLYEELGDSSSSSSDSGSTSRKQHMVQEPAIPPAPPARWISRTVEDKRQAEGGRSTNDEKWSTLKAYRRSKGLCFICGEKWGKDHQCKTSIQLHVVQEMLDCFQSPNSEEETAIEDSPQQLSCYLQQQSSRTCSLLKQ